jgi:NADPH-dependent 2,4-dienoyl-CoA reductase/sulfur reductase-like enzyme
MLCEERTIVSKRIVIVGGDGAGMSAASQAKRRDPSLDVIAFERGSVTSYSACSIPYYVGGLVRTTEELIARTPQEFQARGIAVHIQHDVLGLDLNNQRIHVRDHHGHNTKHAYDELVLATGAAPIIPPWPGVNAHGIFAVKTLEDGRLIREFVERTRPQTAVVVGGGYIGLELAENLRLLGLNTTLLERQDQLMPAFLDADMAEVVHDALTKLDVRVHLSEAVEGFDVVKGHIHAVRTQNGTVPADLVILGLGVEPLSALAGEAGIALGVRHAIRVDPFLRTASPHVWAVGDVTESHHQVTGQPTYVALATVANKQGRIAGLNLTGAAIAFPGVLGTAITRVGTTEIARTGVSRVQAMAAGLQAREARITTETKLGYFPDVAPITVKLVAEVGTGRLLGGQIIGGPGSGKRIDTVATAVTAQMSLTDLIDLDLAYAPPFSDVWDPVQIAARSLATSV